jgi:signal transduction histidine kinase
MSISKRAVVRSNLAKDLPAVDGNVAQVQQLVMNLITNAVEALGDQQGFITVATESVHLGPGSAHVQRANLPDGDYIRLTVADTGCGMTAETRARIFDQFFTTKSQGRGLGLSVVHGIVRSYQGAINVVSAPGKGSTFEILFPCAGRKSPGLNTA